MKCCLDLAPDSVFILLETKREDGQFGPNNSETPKTTMMEQQSNARNNTCKKQDKQHIAASLYSMLVDGLNGLCWSNLEFIPIFLVVHNPSTPRHPTTQITNSHCGIIKGAHHTMLGGQCLDIALHAWMAVKSHVPRCFPWWCLFNGRLRPWSWDSMQTFSEIRNRGSR